LLPIFASKYLIFSSKLLQYYCRKFIEDLQGVKYSGTVAAEFAIVVLEAGPVYLVFVSCFRGSYLAISSGYG
jgi:hypothetical protein